MVEILGTYIYRAVGTCDKDARFRSSKIRVLRGAPGLQVWQCRVIVLTLHRPQNIAYHLTFVTAMGVCISLTFVTAMGVCIFPTFVTTTGVCVFDLHNYAEYKLIYLLRPDLHA